MPQKLSFETGGNLTSFFIITVNFIVLIYYGFSYGGQYTLLVAIIIALINTKKNPKHRKGIYVFVIIGLIFSVAFLYFHGPFVPPAKYGSWINFVIFTISMLILFSIAESYVKLLSAFESERHSQLDDLKLKNEEFQTFNHSVAHDLKEPLRSIAGFSNLLFLNIDKNKLKESEEYKNYINRSVKRMSTLLEDLLSYIETTNQAEIIDKIDLNEALQYAEENLIQHIQEKKAIINKGKLPVIYGNMSFAILLFQNLLNNGLKFTHKGVKPILSVNAEKLEDGYAIYIADNGIGINEKSQQTIFEAFKRGHSKSEYEGSGLGLALCAKIVTKLKGNISIKSSSSKGTTFKIFLPNEVLSA